AVLVVSAGGKILFLREGVVDDAGSALGHDVRHCLQSARSLEIIHPVQRSKLGDKARFRLSKQRPAVALVVPVNVPIDDDAEGMLAVPAITHLTERDAE